MKKSFLLLSLVAFSATMMAAKPTVIDTGHSLKYYHQTNFIPAGTEASQAIELKGDTTVIHSTTSVEKIQFVFGIFIEKLDSAHLKDTTFIRNAQFCDSLCTAYSTVWHTEYDSVMPLAALSAVQGKTSKNLQEQVRIYRGGEYRWVSNNNLGTSLKGNLHVHSNPISGAYIGTSTDDSCLIMHHPIYVNLYVLSGYPYAERLADYQGGKMNVKMYNMNHEKLLDFQMDLNASADSVLMEYVETKSNTLVSNESPKNTFVITGFGIKDSLVIVRESKADTSMLHSALVRAQQLSDSIKSITKFASIKATLDSAITASKPALQLTAYEQNQIDSTAQALIVTISQCEEAIKKATDLEQVSDHKRSQKMLKGEQLIIIRDDVWYDPRGARIK